MMERAKGLQRVAVSGRRRTAWDTPTIGLLIQLAGLALERARIVDDLRELNRILEQHVEERTRERDLKVTRAVRCRYQML
jgi:hypothetical protein